MRLAQDPWTEADVAAAQERLARLAAEEAWARQVCQCVLSLPDRTYLGHRQCRRCERLIRFRRVR